MNFCVKGDQGEGGNRVDLDTVFLGFMGSNPSRRHHHPHMMAFLRQTLCKVNSKYGLTICLWII
jgi:hypothetical protein